MDDQQTTTDGSVAEGGTTIQGISVDDQGMAIPLPEETEQQTTAAPEDVKQDQPDSEESQGESTDSLPDVDESLRKYAESKGLELDSPSAVKAAKIAMDNQAQFQRTRQEATQLKKSMDTVADGIADEEAQITGQDPDTLRTLKRLLVKDSIRDFYDAHPEAKDRESEIAQTVVERPYLVNDLEAAWALVQSKNADSLKAEGKKEALKTLAGKQQAAVPRGNAVHSSSSGSNKITPQNVDQLVSQNNLEWFKAHQDEINRAMAG